jgi:hypothetical protein
VIPQTCSSCAPTAGRSIARSQTSGPERPLVNEGALCSQTLFFFSARAHYLGGLWETNGTGSGTFELAPGVGPSGLSPSSITVLGGQVLLVTFENRTKFSGAAPKSEGLVVRIGKIAQAQCDPPAIVAQPAFDDASHRPRLARTDVDDAQVPA